MGIQDGAEVANQLDKLAEDGRFVLCEEYVGRRTASCGRDSLGRG